MSKRMPLWVAEPSGSENEPTDIMTADGDYYICRTVACKDEPRHARLIAEAPAMLAILEDCARWLEARSNCDRGLYHDVRAIIHKVKGD